MTVDASNCYTIDSTPRLSFAALLDSNDEFTLRIMLYGISFERIGFSKMQTFWN